MTQPPSPSLVFRTPENFRTERLDKWLSRQLPGTSRTELQRWMREGRVRQGDAVLSPRFSLGPDMLIQVSPPASDPVMDTPKASPIRVDVLHEDGDLIVVNKPAGLVMHPAPGHASDTLVNALLHRYPEIGDVGDPRRPGLAHRLDADTSGVLVVARTPAALLHLQAQFKSRQTCKTYLAICHGIPSPVEDAIDLPLGRHPVHRKKRAVNGEGARPALTRYRVKQGLARGNAGLLDIEIETGRTHQIRVHMAHRSHPVLGDTLYGGKRSQLPSPWPKAERQMLHAFRLRLRHPSDNHPMEFEAPMPSDMTEFLLRLTPSSA